MADAIPDFILTISLYAAGALAIGAPLFILVFIRNKLSWWPGRVLFQTKVYRLKEGRSLDMNGRANENDLEFLRDCKGWKVVENKIPSYYMQTGRFSGVMLDAAGFALIRKVGDESFLRVLEISNKVRDPSNYRFLDVPEQLDYRQIESSITATARDLRETIRAEFTRPKTDEFLKSLIIPAMALIALILIVILTLQWSNGVIEKASGLAASSITASTNAGVKEIVYACGGKFYVDPSTGVNSTIPPKPVNVIPFIQGG